MVMDSILFNMNMAKINRTAQALGPKPHGSWAMTLGPITLGSMGPWHFGPCPLANGLGPWGLGHWPLALGKWPLAHGPKPLTAGALAIGMWPVDDFIFSWCSLVVFLIFMYFCLSISLMCLWVSWFALWFSLFLYIFCNAILLSCISFDSQALVYNFQVDS